MRGRPKGVKNGFGVKKWEPKQWKPLYDSICFMVFKNIGHKDISKSLGISVVFVSMIATSEKGREKITELANEQNNAIREENLETTKRIAKNANNVIDKVLENDKLITHEPFKMFDRALKVLHGTSPNVPQQPNYPINSPTTNIGDINILATGEIGARIAEGLARIAEIKANVAIGPRIPAKAIGGPGFSQAAEKVG